MRSTATLASAIALGLCMLLLAACGGSSSGGDGGGSGEGADDDEARLRFAECMREHGVDVPDPQPGGGPIQLGSPDGERGPGALDDPEARDAFEACQDELGDAAPQPPSAQERQEAQDAALRFAECMRSHGVDMPDPQFGSGPGGGGGILFQGRVDTDSPAFREASEACQDKLPSRPGAGPGSGG